MRLSVHIGNNAWLTVGDADTDDLSLVILRFYRSIAVLERFFILAHDYSVPLDGLTDHAAQLPDENRGVDVVDDLRHVLKSLGDVCHLLERTAQAVRDTGCCPGDQADPDSASA